MSLQILWISAIWCPSCLIMQSRYQPYLNHSAIKEIKRFDFDDDTEAIKPYHIGSILPVFIILEDGVERLRIIGEKSKKELHDIFQKVGL